MSDDWRRAIIRAALREVGYDAHGRSWHEVAIHEAIIPPNDLAYDVRNRRHESGPVGDEGVEFAALTTWIDGRGQLGEERAVEHATGKSRRKLCCVDAD